MENQAQERTNEQPSVGVGSRLKPMRAVGIMEARYIKRDDSPVSVGDEDDEQRLSEQEEDKGGTKTESHNDQ